MVNRVEIQKMIEKKREFEHVLADCANRDPRFIKGLLNDANAQLEEKLQIKIPPSIQVCVRQEESDNLYLVLPYLPGNEEESDLELSNKQLETVNGGNDKRSQLLDLMLRKTICY